MRVKSALIATLVLLTFFQPVQAQKKKKSKSKTPQIETFVDSISYAIGVDIANNLKSQDIEFNPEFLSQGLKDQMAGTGKFSETDIQDMMKRFQEMLRTQKDMKENEAAETNLKKGQEFLEANKKKPGVTVTPSGMQYKVLATGSGDSPTINDQVKAHYKGTFIDGRQFDSSYDRGTPATFPLKNVIKGWQEALPMMKVGDKWEIYLPSELCYGTQGMPGNIGPNEAMIFIVELIEVIPGQ